MAQGLTLKNRPDWLIAVKGSSSWVLRCPGSAAFGNDRMAGMGGSDTCILAELFCALKICIG